MQILKPNSHLQASLQTPRGQAACSSSQKGSYQPPAASQAERMASKGYTRVLDKQPGNKQPGDKQPGDKQ